MVGCNSDPTKKLETKSKNILFITIDDLRPQLGCYGQPQMITPNIDQMAEQGVIFERAYCNVPVCGASRASILTGVRPTINRFVTYDTYVENDFPDGATLPGYLKKNGYYTVSNGKIFHHKTDCKDSWSEVWWPNSPLLDYQLDMNISMRNSNDERGPAYEIADVEDSNYIDSKITTKSISDLEILAKKNQPFFLGVGYIRPHLPFNIPKKYWSMYNRDSIKFPVNSNPLSSIPKYAYHDFPELRSYSGIPKHGALSDSLAKTLIHGYYAGVSFIDAQVGLLLDKLDELNLRENTIIVLLGDHGWNLREHGLWCKHCNFETSLHAPLIVDFPGEKEGMRIKNVIEFVDIFPSLCDALDLDQLSQFEGDNFIPLLRNKNAPWDNIAVSKFHDGWTVIQDSYFYTEWVDEEVGMYGNMLFDHKQDPLEEINLINDSNYYHKVIELKNIISKFQRNK